MFLYIENKYRSFRPLIFASPIREVYPGDPFGGKNIVPVASSMERGQENPAHLNRLPVDRDAFRSHMDDYTEDWSIPTDPRRSNSVAYPSLVVRPSYRYSEREFHHHMHNEPSTPINAIDNANRIESLRAYRNDFSTLLNAAERRVGSRPMLRSPNEQVNSNNDNRFSEDNPMISHVPNRRYQQPNYVPSTGLTRSFTERRPRLARTDRNFRRSFTGRVEDYRAEYARRTNFSMETSL